MFKRQSLLIRCLLAIALIVIFNPNFVPTSFANSPIMNRQEVEAMVERQARAWENADVAAIIDDFAQNSLFIAARKQFEGKEAIKTAAEAYFQQFDDIRVKIKRILIDGNSGAVEWDWSDRNRQSKVASFAEDAIIFELQNNKIVYWREYIEKVN